MSNLIRYGHAAWRVWQVRRDLARLGFAGTVERWIGAVDAPAAADPHALARFVHRLGRRLRGSACLDQSLALTSLLRQQGLPARLVIGAERGAARVSAHAWVELDGAALDEHPEPRARLTVLETWPPQ